MSENTKCINLNNGTYCETLKKHVSSDDCKDCPSKIEPFLNENLQLLVD